MTAPGDTSFAPRAVSVDTRLMRASGLYEGLVRGRRFVHNPAGYDALAVLSSRAARLLDNADGRTLGEIARATGETFEALAAEVSLLARNGFVTGEDIAPPVRPRPERVFNVWVHVTNSCNLDCPYCYVEKDAHALSEETAETLRSALVATAEKSGVQRVHMRFAGGEPMLRFAFIRRFFEETRRALAAVGADASGAILTNGTVMPDDALAWLVEHEVSVSVSLDGVGEVQDAMRPAVGGGGSFARVRDNLDRLVARGVAPYMLTTVSALNLGEMPALTSFFLDRSLGFRYSLVRDLASGDALLGHTGVGWREGLVQLRRPAAPTEEGKRLEGPALKRVQDVFDECYSRVEARMPVAPSFRRTHRFCDLELRRPIVKACGAGETYVAVSDRGAVSPCQAALHEDGTRPLAARESLVDVASSLTQLGDFRRRAPDPECARCSHRRSCAGGCPLLLFRRDGHIDGRSPYCEVFRFVIPRILRIGALEVLLDAEARRAT